MQISQVVWYSHLFKNFPQFVVIHTVKGFGIVNKAEIDVFLELSCYHFMANRWETVETVADFIFGGSKSLQMVTAAMKLKDAYSLKGKL